MINTLWFIALAALLIGYAVLDGFDLGVGALHLVLGRTPRERQTAIATIGPVWNANEVWLVAAAGSMVVAFPHLYAAAFSGFYLALMMVVWLLVLRGVAIEFRHQIDHPLWHQAWDVTFCLASALLAILFGVAVGNVLRGVPFDIESHFQGSLALLLNPFALLCGLLSLAALALHGSTYLAMKTDGMLRTRARRATLPLWVATIGLLGAVIAASVVVQPGFAANFARWPALIAVPLLGAASAAAVAWFHAREQDGRAFFASCGLVVGVLGSAAAGLYPQLLPGLPGSAIRGLDIHNAAASAQGMTTALVVGLAGMALVTVYLLNAFRVWRGRTGTD